MQNLENPLPLLTKLSDTVFVDLNLIVGFIFQTEYLPPNVHKRCVLYYANGVTITIDNEGAHQLHLHLQRKHLTIKS